MDSRFRSQHDITIGVEYGAKIFKYKEKDIRLQIWDTVFTLLNYRRDLKPLNLSLELTTKEWQVHCWSMI